MNKGHKQINIMNIVHFFSSLFFWLFVLFVTLSGVGFCTFADCNINIKREREREPYENQEVRDRSSGRKDDSAASGADCPDLLILEDGQYKLYFSNQREVDGVNPLTFQNLGEYTEYQTKMQNDSNNTCAPPLFSRAENDPQGNEVYRFYPTPYNIEGGLPPLPLQSHNNQMPIPYVDASRENTSFNQNMYAGFDPMGFDQGRFNVIDVIHQSTQYNHDMKDLPSENPMDPNWGGVQYSMRLAEKTMERRKIDDAAQTSSATSLATPPDRTFLASSSSTPHSS